MRQRTLRRYISYLTVVGVLLALIVHPVIAQPPPDPSSAPEGPLVVDGSHLPVLQDASRYLAKDIPASARAQARLNRATPPIGTAVDFWSWDFMRGQFHQLTATLERVGDNSEIYVEQGHVLSALVLDAVLHAAETSMIERGRQAFGSEPNPGVDGNPRVTVLLLDIRDSYYYGRSAFVIGGYFWALNQYPQSVLDAWYGGRYKSNEREMIFVDLRATLPGTVSFYQIMAHEFQHLIHWNHDPDEDSWVNEGLSNLAAHLAGYGLPGSHVRAFLRQPNRNLTLATGDPLADYGGCGLFALFLWEQYGGDAMTRLLVSTPQNGIAGIDRALAGRGYADRFAQVLSRWAVANYLDDPAVSGYHGLDIVDGLPDSPTLFARPRLAAQHETYPTQPVTLTVASLGAEYVALSAPSSGDMVITLTAGTNATFVVNIITSTSSSFVTGSNVLREVVVAAGRTVSTVIPRAGETYTRVLLVPVHLSQNSLMGTLVYQVGLSERAAVEPPPSPPPSTPSLTLRINTGGQQYVDGAGQVWQADRPYATGGAGYVGGQNHAWSASIGNTTDQTLYQTERWGLRAYTFDLPDGMYRVTLRFSEGYFTSAGRRVFDVQLEGRTVLSSFDIFKAAGGTSRAYDCSFTTEVRDGQLVVAFIPRKSEPAINAIAVEAIGP